MPTATVKKKINKLLTDKKSSAKTGAITKNAYSTLQQTITEKDILLSLNNDIAAVRDKKDILQLIHPKLKQLFNTDDIFICCYDAAQQTLNPVVRVGGKNRNKHRDYERIINTNFPVNDGFIDTILNSKEPLVFDIDEVLRMPTPPGYMKISKTTGLAETLSQSLYHADELIGIITLWSEKKNFFTHRHKKLIAQIAGQISIIIINILANEEIKRREAEKSLLLSLSNEMAMVRGHEDLAKIINQKLKKLFLISDFTIVAINENKLTYGAFLYDQADCLYEKKREYLENLFNNFKFEAGLYDVVLAADEPVVFNIAEIMKRETVPGHIQFFHSLGIAEIVGTALRIGNDDIGILWIQPEKANCFDAVNQHVFKAVCSQISIALANIIANEDIQRRQEEKEILLLLSNDIASIRNRTDLLGIITKQLKKLFNYNDASIIILNKKEKNYSAFVLDMEERRTSHEECLPNSTGTYPIADGICNTILHAGQPIILHYREVLKNPAAPSWAFFLHKTGINEMVCVTLKDGNEDIGAFFLHSETENYFKEYQLNLVQGIAYQLSVALANVLANEKIAMQLEEINHYKSQLEEENIYLQQQIEKVYNYSEIIGSGPGMQKVFHLISQVSFANSTVLILGETGTGKELIARAIHNASPRKNKLMVKVNCAALPPNLIESELFGHERGSFTGATERRIGKFELANHSTLFLDEIGELSPEVQVKLLRALQEKEIERIGGKAPIKIDVRIITATNRNLQKEVDDGNFRSDLFYRLNVFPITMPPLRERKEDIPELVTHFIARYARAAGKKISTLSRKVMKELMDYKWPGNVRELEHLVERTVLITDGDIIKTIHLPVIEQNKLKNKQADLYIKTIEENEREHILEVLQKCEGRIFGKNGAADVLGVPVSTLNSRIKKLGIKKEQLFFVKK
jgi:formate hydrogenlyase transcriptional activator